jgi:hypothetical protein
MNQQQFWLGGLIREILYDRGNQIIPLKLGWELSKVTVAHISEVCVQRPKRSLGGRTSRAVAVLADAALN